MVIYLLFGIALFAQPTVKTLTTTVNNSHYVAGGDSSDFFNSSILLYRPNYAVHFEYGTDGNYGNTTTPTSLSEETTRRVVFTTFTNKVMLHF